MENEEKEKIAKAFVKQNQPESDKNKNDSFKNLEKLEVEEIKRIDLEKCSKDSWHKIKLLLQSFRPEGSNIKKLEENEAILEEERAKHATTLMKYIEGKGYTIHANVTPGHEDIFGLDQPFTEKRIAFPKHIMTTDPREDVRGQKLRLRNDIPILYSLSGFAHEATHLDRYFSDASVTQVMNQMIEVKYLEKPPVFKINQAGEIEPAAIEEEAQTDVQAYFLLKKLGIEIEPENYCTYVGRGPEWQQIIYERIRTKMNK